MHVVQKVHVDPGTMSQKRVAFPWHGRCTSRCLVPSASIRVTSILILFPLVGNLGCSAAEDLPNSTSFTPTANVPSRDQLCLDIDKDGFGQGCKKGSDCDDRDPARAEECEVLTSSCEPGTVQSCFVLQSLDEVNIECSEGTRTCSSNGRWAACNMHKTYSLSSQAILSAAVTGPVTCHPCDPACNLHSDYPTSSDLDSSNSEGVAYEPAEGGIVLSGGGSGGSGYVDADGDGVPAHPTEPWGDVDDSDPTRDGFTENDGIFHVLPYGESAISPMDIPLKLSTADIYFLMDTTGSMQGEIDQLKSSLVSGDFTIDSTVCPNLSNAERAGIIGAIRCDITDANFGVGYFDDYPLTAYASGVEYGAASCNNSATGTLHDRPFHNLLAISPASTAAERALINTAVNKYVADCGGDDPESQIPAFYSIATGNRLVKGSSYTAGTQKTLDFHPAPSTPTTYQHTHTIAVGASAGEDIGSAYDLGNIGTFSGATLQGTTNGMANNMSASCGGSAADAVFKFAVTEQDFYLISDVNSQSGVALYRSTGAEIACGNRLRKKLSPGDYYVAVDRNGSYELRISRMLADTEATAFDIGNISTGWQRVEGDTGRDYLQGNYGASCNSSAGSTRDAVLAFQVSEAGNYSFSFAESEFRPVISIMNWNFSERACFDSDTGSATLAAGNYFLIVDGDESSQAGHFVAEIGPSHGETFETALNIGDVAGSWTQYSGNITNAFDDYSDTPCWNGYSRSAKDQVLRFEVSTRSDIAIIGRSQRVDFRMDLRDANFKPLYCQTGVEDGGGIFQRLDPGTYHLVIQGEWRSSDIGDYWVSIGNWQSGWHVNAPPSCAAGGFGFPCFRQGTVPIVVAFTDAPMHNGPSDAENPYENLDSSSAYFWAPAYHDATWALRREGIKVIGINSGDVGAVTCSESCTASHTEQDCAERSNCLGFTETCRTVTRCQGSTCWQEQQCNNECTGGYETRELCYPVEVCDSYGGKVCTGDASTSNFALSSVAYDTGAVDGDGTPLVYNINADGSGLDSAVVQAIHDLAQYNRMDVTLRVNDNADTPSFDESQFVKQVFAAPTAETNARCRATHGTWFEGCLPGTNPIFSVTFTNDLVPSTTDWQVFNFTIDLIGDGTYTLKTVPIRIVVPPTSTSSGPSQGSYARTYDAACDGRQQPDWGVLEWSAQTPTDSRITFEIRTADTRAALDAATPVTLDVPGDTPPVDIGTLLQDTGLKNHQQYLQVVSRLFAATNGTSPVLQGFELTYHCVSFE